MKVSFSGPALTDLDEILQNIRTKSPRGALRVEARLFDILKTVAQHPEGFEAVAGVDRVRRAPLVRYPYVVYYRVGDGEVKIVRILHGKRQPKTPPSAAGH